MGVSPFLSTMLPSGDVIECVVCDLAKRIDVSNERIINPDLIILFMTKRVLRVVLCKNTKK